MSLTSLAVVRQTDSISTQILLHLHLKVEEDRLKVGRWFSICSETSEMVVRFNPANLYINLRRSRDGTVFVCACVHAFVHSFVCSFVLHSVHFGQLLR